MKLTKTKRDHSVSFQITPMIDIVFLLIIFFMTVSQITRVIDQPLPLPVVPTAVVADSPATATINIDRRGQIFVGGKKLTLENSMQILENKLSQLEPDTNRLRIEVRCDRRCPSQYVNRIIERLSALGIESVRISVSAGDD